MAKSAKRIGAIIGAVIAFLLLVAFVVLYCLHLLPWMERIYPEGTVGNFSGNLHNSGLFCEYNGVVYFSNASDNGCLYSMNPDETDKKKLQNVSVRGIMCAGTKIYYSQFSAHMAATPGGLGYLRGTHSLSRAAIKNQRVESLTTDLIIDAQLVGNSIYYLTAKDNQISFSKMKPDGKDKTKLADYAIDPSCSDGRYIYYEDTLNGHYLMALDTQDDVSRDVYRGGVYSPTLVGDYIYFLDVDRDYCLARYNLSTAVLQILTSDRVDCFNVAGDYVYYQCNSEDAPCLKMMRADGSSPIVLAEGNYTNINVTSEYVYFQEFGTDYILYHSPIGSTYFEAF